MSHPTQRHTFRATVALVATAARAKLPQAVNGRVESAAKLVLWQDVEPQADGSILVGSSTDPGKTYRLVGMSCECQDFTRDQAPGGWCQHRIAAGIAKRVGQILAAPPEPEGPAPMDPEMLEAYPDNDWPEGDPEENPVAEPTRPPENLSSTVTGSFLPEVRSSANVHITIAGRDVQVTLRDHDEAQLLVRLQTLLAGYPLPQPAAQPTSQREGWCGKHQVSMKWNAGKDGRQGWFSHRTQDGWCQGK
jgi:hypothetical protein